MRMTAGLLPALLTAAIWMGGATFAEAGSTFDISLTASTANFSESQFDFNGQHYDRFYVDLSGLSQDNAFTVSQGDSINNTVTFDNEVTIPGSEDHTNLLQDLTGSTFEDENTGVTGTMDFYDHGVLVASFDYTSTTSGLLSSYAAVFPPSNTAFTFDSFTNDFLIYDLADSARLDGSDFFYDLVSDNVVPEPGTLALVAAGLAVFGALRLRKSTKSA
jgi:hypothetical protein